jgi:hypothetical protein
LQHVDFTGDWYFDRFGGPHGQVLHTPEIVVLTSKVMELYPTSGDKPAMFLKRNK